MRRVGLIPEEEPVKVISTVTTIPEGGIVSAGYISTEPIKKTVSKPVGKDKK